MKLCKCGCGNPVKVISKTSIKQGRIKGQFNTYLKGHAPMSELEKRNKRERFTGKNNPMHLLSSYKKKLWRQKISEKTQGRIPWNKGKILPERSQEKHPRWKGGRNINKGGYIIISLPRGKKKREHRLIIEKKLCRELLSTEVVHHIDNNPANNNLENLAVMDFREHARLHALGKI